MRQGLREELASFERLYGVRARSIRGDGFIWVGWTEKTQCLVEAGILLGVTTSEAEE